MLHRLKQRIAQIFDPRDSSRDVDVKVIGMSDKFLTVQAGNSFYTFSWEYTKHIDDDNLKRRALQHNLFMRLLVDHTDPEDMAAIKKTIEAVPFKL